MARHMAIRDAPTKISMWMGAIVMLTNRGIDRTRSSRMCLEETPDFLRDTPEQERLWFEQRPPRDFDFDK